MSGEIVITPLFFHPVTGVALGAVAAGYVVAELLQARREARRREAAQKRQALAQWRQFQSDKADAVAERQSVLRALQDSLQGVIQELPPTPQQDNRTNPAAQGTVVKETPQQIRRGFLQPSQPQPDTQLQSSLQLCAAMLQRATQAREDADSPWHNLQKQYSDYARKLQDGAFLDLRELQSFQKTIVDSLTHWSQIKEEAARQQLRCFEQAEHLLAGLIDYQYMQTQDLHVEPLQILQRELEAKIHTGTVDWGALDVISGRFATIQKKIDGELEKELLVQHLMEKITTHLESMHYTPVEPFTANSAAQYKAVFAMPEGELVQAVVQPDMKLVFQMVHEAEAESGRMSDTEYAFFRSQETVWCGDLKNLMQRLADDGIGYEVEFERNAQKESIPVVLVETVNELLRKLKRETTHRPARRKTADNKRYFHDRDQ